MAICLIQGTSHGTGHDRNVVDAAGIECSLDQGAGREWGMVLVQVSDLQYALVGQHFGEAVGTEHQQVTGEDFERKKIAVQDKAKPYRPGQDVPVRMACGLFRSEAAVAHIVVNEGMVSSQLRDASRSDEIGPAVADIENQEAGGGLREQVGHH